MEFHRTKVHDAHAYMSDIRIAFMMAFHPRLGVDSLIRRYVAKDVARMIMQQYVTIGTHVVLWNDEPFHNAEDVHFWLQRIDDGPQQIRMWKPVTRGKMQNAIPVVIQTPKMRVVFDADGVNERKKNLVLEPVEQIHEFKTLIETVDANAASQLPKRSSLVNYKSSLREPSARHNITLSCKLLPSVHVFGRRGERMHTPKEKMIKRNSIVRVIMKLNLICETQTAYIPCWQTIQIQLVNEPDVLPDFAFAIDE